MNFLEIASFSSFCMLQQVTEPTCRCQKATGSDVLQPQKEDAGEFQSEYAQKAQLPKRSGSQSECRAVLILRLAANFFVNVLSKLYPVFEHAPEIIKIRQIGIYCHCPLKQFCCLMNPVQKVQQPALVVHG